MHEAGSGEYTAEERRWRHVQHLLGGCACRPYTTAAEGYMRRAPTLSDLRADLLTALPASRAATVRDAVACAATGCPDGVRTGFMPLFLDPVLFLGTGVPAPAASLACRYVAAYIVYVGAMLARETVDSTELEALRLPSDSNMARASPFCAIDWGSNDEVWLHPAPPPACPPPVAPTPPTRSAREGARPKPSGYGAIDD